jgi:REP element-mobilizing transposase RayT
LSGFGLLLLHSPGKVKIFPGLESHQRQLVDSSDPFYSCTGPPAHNPTNGSWWIVQILSTANSTPHTKTSYSDLYESHTLHEPQVGLSTSLFSMVPDHIHLIVRIVPSMSIEECALLLMNNGQHFVGKVYPQVLIEAGINQLWQPSAYAGTCGEYTSGLIQNWLNSRE